MPSKELTKPELVELFTHLPRYARAFWTQPPEPPAEMPDMNMTHVKTLVFLRLNGSAPMSAAARWLNLEKGSFTPVARRLADAGLVETVADESDRRRTVLRLTEKGAALDKTLHARMSAEFRRKVALLTDDEQRDFFESLRRLNAILDKLAAADGGKGAAPFPAFDPDRPPPHGPHCHPFHGRAPGAQEGTPRCSD